MTNEPKMLAIIVSLIKKTRDDELQWEELATGSGFFSIFAERLSISVLRVESSREEAEDFIDYVLQVRNSEGKIIEEVSDPEFSQASNAFLKMKSLYGLARSNAYRVDATLDKLLSSLGGKEEDES